MSHTSTQRAGERTRQPSAVAMLTSASSLKHRRQLDHGLFAQGGGIMRIGPLERVTDFAAPDAIFVGFRLGIEARMNHLYGPPAAASTARHRYAGACRA